ncbi:putative ybl58 [Escherichia coli 3-020-07_S3_C1]|nr:putative prophage protein [Escherichia coli VR50]EFU96670.1 conserved hypothetical protein [Escherichia coli 3431]EYD89645.1 putative ybl58 [Escherichia coli 1-176-05_S3_C1]KDU24147.1 putative ybl58 [Escherichia coli 3-073-06_S4_C1]KDX17160.1 hypothetical protein AC45_5243 [Escherichia coli 2-210-07_S3_C3]KDY11484.1 putative ybl58 [Escherichia coli 2-316-03_S4_C2]KDY61421.1 putative ybl58 [Escherichia coli 2-460-02_S4_C2]KDY72334.1 putative ybl58 [Escherichia coli 2-460-02_S4_C3]KDZ34810
MQSTLASIQFESCNPKWSQEQQDSFRRLAVLLDEKYAGKITISADSSENP